MPCTPPRPALSIEDVGQAYKDNMESYGVCIVLHQGLINAIKDRNEQ